MVSNEFLLIEKIKNILGKVSKSEVIIGIGDDASVLDIGLEKDFLLFCSDSIVDGKHFVFNIPEKSLIGRKAIGVVLSDIAAMGGYPLYVTLDIGIPGYVNEGDIEEIIDGMNFLLELFSVDVVGGDVVSSDVLYLSLSCIGKVEKKNLVKRSGAKKLDKIWVSGPLGGSIYGRHLMVSPRIPEARFLVQNFSPTAMIDVSDGLVADLYHILEDSCCIGQIDVEAIPVHKDAKSIDEALYMGEDFELLFCLSEEDSKRLESNMSNLPYKFYKIGEVTDSGSVGLYVKDGSSRYPILPKGFRHF